MEESKIREMTDEEMADEYAVKNWGCYEKGQTDYKALKQAYLAGLKTGRDAAETDLATVAYMQGAEQQKRKSKEQLTKAKELILKLYNAGRDVLMCRAEEKSMTICQMQ